MLSRILPSQRTTLQAHWFAQQVDMPTLQRTYSVTQLRVFGKIWSDDLLEEEAQMRIRDATRKYFEEQQRIRRRERWDGIRPDIPWIQMPEGNAIVGQPASADQRVPVFRADMTTQDLVSMVEISYRVTGVTMFDIESVEPFDSPASRSARPGSHTGFRTKGIA
jgi:hypothetical protein